MKIDIKNDIINCFHKEMNEIIFYEDKNNISELYEFMFDLARKSATDKNCRVQHEQIQRYIDLLAIKGINLPDIISKHIVENIYELRPGCNRIIYFYYGRNVFVLLHIFRKKTNKTPLSEIKKAIRERDDYIRRNGGNQK